MSEPLTVKGGVGGGAVKTLDRLQLHHQPFYLVRCIWADQSNFESDLRIPHLVRCREALCSPSQQKQNLWTVYQSRQQGQRNLTPIQQNSEVPHLQNKQLLSALMDETKCFLANSAHMSWFDWCEVNVTSKTTAFLEPLFRGHDSMIEIHLMIKTDVYLLLLS